MKQNASYQKKLRKREQETLEKNDLDVAETQTESETQ